MPIPPEALSFSLLSFEGPDPYSKAGGLGVRITHLAHTLARRGFETHLFFVGDPHAPGLERLEGGRLTYHRWCQWISAHYPEGVYAGEEGKLQDWNASLPPYLIEHILRPALAEGRVPVILAEEWHTAETLIRLHDQLHAAGLGGRCLAFWNANNTKSFHRVDWPRLEAAARLTTVSRYMKHRMWDFGVDPLAIPNGIPAELLRPVPAAHRTAVRQLLAPEEDALLLFKAGRFDPDKRWLMAVEAAAQLKHQGYPLAFPLTGGVEPHGAEVLGRAHSLGLSITEINGHPESWEDFTALLREAPRADIYNLRFFMSQAMLRSFYSAADAVLANSGHEPFGLVGLEAMAAGGLVFTGATGEEYALDGCNAIVLNTDQPEEIISQVLRLQADPEREQTIREAARRDATEFTWDRIVDVLLDKITFCAQTQGLLMTQEDTFVPTKRVRDVLIYTVVHQPRRLRLPAQPLPEDGSPAALAGALFDDAMNERYFHKVARTCYQPALDRFQALVDRGLKLAIGFSLSFIEQAERWDAELLGGFRTLVQRKNVELVAVEPTHSFILLWDVPRFIERMKMAADRLEAVFGARPRIADTTELMMSDPIYHALDRAGFNGGLMDGRPWVMEWREPTHLYHHDGGRMKLFTRHYQLSDDVGYRFSNRSWSGWPLTADRYAAWLSNHPGDLVVLGWDFETFGEHHRVESGIFEFLDALPEEARRHGLSFVTPSEALERHGTQSYDLPLPAFASTWAGSGGLEFFLGNDAQRAVFHLMIQAYQKARLTGDPTALELASWLAQSDNLHLIQWYGRSGSEAEVSAYFTPREWWGLTPDGIIWEIQQVYKHFIDALDAHLQKETAQQPDTSARTSQRPPAPLKGVFPD